MTNNTTVETNTTLEPDALSIYQVNGAMGAGHKTPEGLAICARNSLKHGGYGRRGVLTKEEDPDAYDAYRLGLLHCMAPRNLLEMELADEYIWQGWLKWRVERYITAVEDAFRNDQKFLEELERLDRVLSHVWARRERAWKRLEEIKRSYGKTLGRAEPFNPDDPIPDLYRMEFNPLKQPRPQTEALAAEAVAAETQPEAVETVTGKAPAADAVPSLKPLSQEQPASFRETPDAENQIHPIHPLLKPQNGTDRLTS